MSCFELWRNYKLFFVAFEKQTFELWNSYTYWRKTWCCLVCLAKKHDPQHDIYVKRMYSWKAPWKFSKITWRTQAPLELVHAYVWQMKASLFDNKIYLIMLVDDYRRMMYEYFLGSKLEAIPSLLKFKMSWHQILLAYNWSKSLYTIKRTE